MSALAEAIAQGNFGGAPKRAGLAVMLRLRAVLQRRGWVTLARREAAIQGACGEATQSQRAVDLKRFPRSEPDAAFDQGSQYEWGASICSGVMPAARLPP